jgi:uncharacterized membrane protein
MKNVWKWIIGIVLALLVIGAVVGVVFMVRNHSFVRAEVNGCVRPGLNNREPGTVPNNFDGGRYGFGIQMRGPGMMGFGFRPLGFLMGIIPLGFLTLVILGIIWLVKAIRKPNTIAAPIMTCKNCSETVQADWKNCPHCGKKL